MITTAKQGFAFGPFRLDLEERLLLRDGEPIDVTAKLFDLLALLVRNQGRLVEKEDILEKLWPDGLVEEGNLSVRISALRRALGEHASDPQYIQTVPGRGYRFVAQVTELLSEEAVQEARAAKEAEDYPLTKIGRLATDMGVTDLSTRHSEYAHVPLEANGRES
ncbi:MAG: transcriptional regulator [Acidobacteriota bacterium]